jgi:acyl-CoA synthetase (AMP-forming)/AMP-acid ligase II
VAFFDVLSFTYITDVINVAGHRLSTAEIESALIVHPGVAEAAVVGATDDLTGQAVHAFVTLKPCVPRPTLLMIIIFRFADPFFFFVCPFQRV